MVWVADIELMDVLKMGKKSLPTMHKIDTSIHLLQSFFLIILSYFSFILVVYLLGEVEVTTPILRFFSSAPCLPLASLIFLWT